MKLQIALPAALLGLGAIAAPAETGNQVQNTNTYVQVLLEAPQNWVAGARLFPSNVIAGYNGDLCDYTAEDWAKFVQDKCKTFAECTSSLSFSGMAFFLIKDDPPANQPVVMALAGISSGSPRTRTWFGYVFRGGATTQADYVRLEDVEKSVAYSIAV
ncbi:unnamed protein product [Clonostachys rosea f. rosea IK726]|uniref:Uncharacterized protein n=1 Tax=Clonostachys rosea f. rosea IK726 TaxID=1349383 RepID=A0ACA9U2R0_BIOOC|nr:unnamed protein product [Clonostachys rosea f. rosea IK726]